MPVDFHASATHVFDHIAVLHAGLDRPERGRFTVSPKVARHAAQAGVSVIVAAPDRRATNPLVLGSWGDVRLIGQRGFAMVEHGAGQDYQIQPDTDTTPDYAHSCGLELLLAPNEATAHRNRLHHPHARIEVVGSAKVEAWSALRAASRVDAASETFPDFSRRSAGSLPYKDYKDGTTSVEVADPRGSSQQEATTDRIPVVAFAWHWESPLHPCARSAFRHWVDALHRLARIPDAERGYRIVGHGHPRFAPTLKALYRRVGVEWWDAEQVIGSADVLVADNTSFMWECAAVGIPLVLLDAPWFDTNGEEWGLRFWEASDCGERIGTGSADELHAAIVRTLVQDPQAQRRAEVIKQVYPIIGGALEASLAAIRSL